MLLCARASAGAFRSTVVRSLSLAGGTTGQRAFALAGVVAGAATTRRGFFTRSFLPSALAGVVAAGAATKKGVVENVGGVQTLLFLNSTHSAVRSKQHRETTRYLFCIPQAGGGRARALSCIEYGRPFSYQQGPQHSSQQQGSPYQQGNLFAHGGKADSRPRREGKRVGAMIRMAVVYFLTATGLVVWIVQLVELGMFYYFPERYEEIMAHELEEERRRDKFYDIDPSLPDDDYFKELGAKDEALLQLTSRIQLQSNVVTRALAGVDNPQAALQVTYLNCKEEEESFAKGPARASALRASSTIWRPRFFLEVTGESKGARAAIGEATFEQCEGDWVPTSLSIVALTKERQVVETKLPLPHGLKYVSLRALAVTSSSSSSSSSSAAA